MFKQLLAAAGVGGAEVETELFTPGVQPGGLVEGVIRLRGGKVAQDVGQVAIEFVTRAEQEYSDGEETVSTVGFGRGAVTGPFTLHPGQLAEFRFGAPAPLETPITFYNGRVLPGAYVAVRTVVEIRGAVDAADTDPIGIGALPAQHVLLEAVERMGFPLVRTDVEAGHIRDTPQTLPFYQEIEFGRSPHFPRVNQLEVTFVPAAHGMSVVLEADIDGGWLREDRDGIGILWVDYDRLGHHDWSAEIHHRLGTLGALH
ncbi:sporulation protein [Nocardia thailandica]|uniref:sporulation protein n=1 Tax=Nocardia thailandica TaxID=257275 RepID=UPI0002E05173|nr:sporulation protein [Nocardia thailandica]